MYLIRGEKIKDYKDIAEVTAKAFCNQDYIGEVSMIDSLRRGSQFDSELSLVACFEEKVVGHVLFTPQLSYINEKPVPSVILGPIAVLPEYQKSGIGRLLIEEGHKIAYNKGYKFSFLWGHDTYYPKFGYKTNMFGDSRFKINLEKIEKETVDITLRRVVKEDIPFLLKMWDKWYKPVDLAIKPSDSLLDWISNYNNIVAHVIEKDHEIVGYIRYEKNHLERIKMFLAKDKLATDMIMNYIKNELDNIILSLPIYETEFTMQMFNGYDVEFINKTWGASMICILDEKEDLIKNYCQEVINGTRKPGHIILSPGFEME